MKIKICTPVIGRTLDEFLKNLDRIQEVSDMVELRVDKIKNLKEKGLILIKKRTKKESILTGAKKELIKKALEFGFDFVDVELSLISCLELTKREKKRVILSFHDFEKTPNILELTAMVNNMRKFAVGVIKIATMVNNDNDLGNLFRLIMNKKKNEKMIIVGMGKKGKMTRILLPLLGSFLTFASTKFGTTAPGQIDIDKLKNIYKLITQ